MASSGTHLHLPLGQQLLPGPLANVIRVTGLEGYSGHGSLPQADFPAHSPTEPASSSLFKGTNEKKKGGKKINRLFSSLSVSLRTIVKRGKEAGSFSESDTGFVCWRDGGGEANEVERG